MITGFDFDFGHKCFTKGHILLFIYCDQCIKLAVHFMGKVQSFVRPTNFFGKNCTAHYIMKSSIADILGFGLHSLHHTAIIQSVMCEGSEHTHLHAVKDTIQFLWRVPLDMMLHTIRQT